MGKSKSYEEFIDKFKPKKTTDDCYTPPNIYQVISDWVAKEYGVEPSRFIRPFYPGGDYQAVDYKPWDIVVDNPPFSIMAQIVAFYKDAGIKFFLFAPALTLFNPACSAVCTGNSITYKNGAQVATSFLTNMESCRFRSAPDLYQAIEKANRENMNETHKELPKYTYPDYVVTAAFVQKLSKYDVSFRCSIGETEYIRGLDSQRECGKSIFGSGYLLSSRAAAEKAAAEKAAAEKAAAKIWKLSERELIMVHRLDAARESAAVNVDESWKRVSAGRDERTGLSGSTGFAATAAGKAYEKRNDSTHEQMSLF